MSAHFHCTVYREPCCTMYSWHTVQCTVYRCVALNTVHMAMISCYTVYCTGVSLYVEGSIVQVVSRDPTVPYC